MWKVISKLTVPFVPQDLLCTQNILHQQLRTTFILKRRVTPPLHKSGFPLKKLRNRHYVFDLVKDTEIEKQSNLDVILTSYVDGIGNSGDKVSLKAEFAYKSLLLPGLAVYATPENENKYQNFIPEDQIVKYSSPFALKTMGLLSNMTLGVIMNKESPWTLQPWHIKASFRKCGYNVPEEAIELPPKSIKGPILDKDGQEFYVTVTINNQEKVIVRCRLRHWSTNILDKLPYEEEFWKKNVEPIYPEFAQVLDKLPKYIEN